LIDLAWILAMSARADIHAPQEAVRLAERVANLTKFQNATVLDALAIAYFSAGPHRRCDQHAADGSRSGV
jgi:hypothetical protein